MRKGFLLSLGTLALGACLSFAQQGNIGKTLPSEVDVQVLPPLKVVPKERSKEPCTVLPPLVVEKPEPKPAAPRPTAALAAECPPPPEICHIPFWKKCLLWCKKIFFWWRD
jgi:hypothetical protein